MGNQAKKRLQAFKTHKNLVLNKKRTADIFQESIGDIASKEFGNIKELLTFRWKGDISKMIQENLFYWRLFWVQPFLYVFIWWDVAIS